MKFKVGDKARVIARYSNHSFEIGEIVNIDYVVSKDNDCECSNRDHNYWLIDQELEPIESTIVIKENTDIKDFALQVVKYLEDHYGEHNNKAFLEVVNDKLK